MIQITLPDGSKKPFEHPVSVQDVAASIGAGLAKATLAGKVDGRLVDASYAIDHDAGLEIVTEKSPEALEILRHSTAHLLAQAVQRLYPGRAGHHRPGDRQRLLLRLRLRAALHAGGPGEDRGGDAEDRRREAAGASAA